MLGAVVADSQDDQGRLYGYIQDSRGAPVSGALISVFGRGLRGGLVTFSDQTGRVVVPKLPAGAYTLRALAGRDRSGAIQKVTVRPNQDAVFALSLRSVLDDPDALAGDDLATEPARRLRWLVRNKQRSILESLSHGVPGVPTDKNLDSVPQASGVLGEALPWLPDLEGSLEWARPVGGEAGALGDPATANLGAVRLRGRLNDAIEWSLGGLVAESDSDSWRMAAEFVIEPGDGHRIEAGAAYGDTLMRRSLTNGAIADEGSTGALFVIDRFEQGPVQVEAGARYSYISFLSQGNHVSPLARVSAKTGEHTRFRLGYTTQAVVPGGDLLALSTLGVAPRVTEVFADAGLRAERVAHLELAGVRSAGPVDLTAFAFAERIRDPLVNAYKHGPRPRLAVTNGLDARCDGLGVALGRRFGTVADSSITYSYGRQRALTGPAAAPAHFHDIVARAEAVFESTDTRISGLYRWNSLGTPADARGRAVATRFDVQLSQGLPFLGHLTRAQWDLLVAYRNLLYDASEGAFLDEVMVKNPPKRVVGGVSVRF